jgi:hypothetical protein
MVRRTTLMLRQSFLNFKRDDCWCVFVNAVKDCRLKKKTIFSVNCYGDLKS